MYTRLVDQVMCLFLIALFCGVVLLSEVCAAPPFTLSDIITNVERNEILYSNIDTRIFEDYSYQGRKKTYADPRKKQISSGSYNVHYVSQDGKFHVKTGIDYLYSSQEQDSQHRLRKFDGALTRSIEAKKPDIAGIVNINSLRAPDEKALSTHMMLLRDTRLLIPLSTYLSGHKAVSASSNGDWDSQFILEVEYKGQEVLDSLECHIVSITTLFKKSMQPHDRWVLWLSEDRNYLPVQREGYTLRYSSEIPVSTGFSSNWKEIETGIWLPMHSEITAYNKDIIRNQGSQQPIWKRTYTLEEVSLNPDYPDSFFRDFPIPDGSAVYEVDGKTITKSYTKGATTNDGSTPAKPLWGSLFLWGNAILVGALAYLVMRRRSQAANR